MREYYRGNESNDRRMTLKACQTRRAVEMSVKMVQECFPRSTHGRGRGLWAHPPRASSRTLQVPLNTMQHF